MRILAVDGFYKGRFLPKMERGFYSILIDLGDYNLEDNRFFKQTYYMHLFRYDNEEFNIYSQSQEGFEANQSLINFFSEYKENKNELNKISKLLN